MTKYTILRRTEYGKTGPYWEEFATSSGANDEAAIKAVLAEISTNGDPSGEYVAVPVRSWKPRKVETKQAFSFS